MFHKEHNVHFALISFVRQTCCAFLLYLWRPTDFQQEVSTTELHLGRVFMTTGHSEFFLVNTLDWDPGDLGLTLWFFQIMVRLQTKS